MPIDPTKVAAAVSGGLSIVCATCENYWEARDRGVSDDACLAKQGCGSPIAGDVFHEYRGPMTQFDKFCFVCGDRATHALRVKPYVRVIGACDDHVDMVDKLKAKGKNPVSISILSDGGERASKEEQSPSKKMILRFKSSSNGE